MDASLSSAPDKFNVWLDMMEAILNNNRDVEFMKYDSRRRNLSSFIRCTFKLDDNYRGTLDDLDDRVTMWHVNGIKYAGCDFEINNVF